MENDAQHEVSHCVGVKSTENRMKSDMASGNVANASQSYSIRLNYPIQIKQRVGRFIPTQFTWTVSMAFYLIPAERLFDSWVNLSSYYSNV